MTNVATGVLLLLACSSSFAHAATFAVAKEHPIVDVISLLEKLQVQAKEEGEAEAVDYQKFVYWCKHAEKDLSASIAKHKENIEIAKDQIAATEKEIKTLEASIEKLTAELTERNAANVKAEKVRKEQEADYLAEQSDLQETIEAFQLAIETLEKTQDHKGSLLAKKAVKRAVLLSESLVTDQQHKVLQSFLQEEQPAAGPAAAGADPKYAARTGRLRTYDAKSGGVIELLKSLKADFEKQKVESTKEETNAKNAYNLAKQANDYAISEAEKSKAAKEEILGEKKSDLEGLKSTLADEESALAAETTQLENVQGDCSTKATEWEARSATRAGEIEAMAMAIKILSKVTNVRNVDTHEIARRNPGPPAEFLQMSSSSSRKAEDPRQKAMNLLKQVATRTHSKALQKLAQEIATYDGPFDKIVQMIQKMIFRLMAEQKDEDDHKAWCDLELSKTQDSKDDKENKMEMLNRKIDAATAEVADLTGKIAENEKAIAKITAYMQEETQIRQENKEENVAAIKDAQDAQAAIAQAVAVLKGFYKESGMIAKEPYEFVQTGDVELPEKPSTWDASYTGVADPNEEGTGVLAILARISEDYATMEAETKAAEETDEKDFQADMTAQTVDKAEKVKDSEMKTQRKDALIQKLDHMATEKSHLTKELEAVIQYLKDLEPACVIGDSSYEDRKQARADEIAALRKAQTILEEAFLPDEAKTAEFLQKRK